MITRIGTGQRHLDAVLGEGIPENSIAVIAGAPGTGKTMLAQQFLFHNATAERPGLYLTTDAEPVDKVVRFGQELAFFDRAAVGASVRYESLLPGLIAGGLEAVLEQIITLLRDVRPGLLVIDSIRSLRLHADDDLAHRRFLAELAGRLSALPVTTIWVGEFSREELATGPEAAIADFIVFLAAASGGQRLARHLTVVKLRGGSYLSGDHAYRLDQNGLLVFPRLADPVSERSKAPSATRISLGSPGLDALVGGGAWLGTTTLLVGPSGAGKTMLGLDFLGAGARAGRKGVFATLEENLPQLDRILSAPGRQSMDGHVTVHRRSPVDIYIDEWVHELLDVAESRNADLIVIDSLSDLALAAPDQKRFDEYVYSLSQRLSAAGVTAMMTLETRPSFGLAEGSGARLSHLSDNVLLVGYLVDGATVRHIIHALKTRASWHDEFVREFSIGPEGITVGDAVAGVTLQRVVSHHDESP